jgi:hypothetical protein
MAKGFSLVTITKGVAGLVTIWDSSEQIVLFADTDTAGTMWFPIIPISSLAINPFSNYWQFGTNQTVLVGGPYFVRSATLSAGGTALNLRGDLKDSVRLILIGLPISVRSLTWNGQYVEADLSMAISSSGATSSIVQSEFIVPHHHLPAVAPLEPPVLKEWRYANGLPEIDKEYLDSNWVLANHTFTNIPYKPYGIGTVLYGCDYGL